MRPVKMRPEKPLPLQLHSARTASKSDWKERKKRAKDPDYRARRRVIDPTRWDSVHLKGMWLEVITATPPRSPSPLKDEPPAQITKLKDLFAPREEEGSHFDFFNSLNLCLCSP